MAIVLEGCQVASVRVDMVKGRVRVTFSAAFDEAMLDVREQLAQLAFGKDLVDLHVERWQPTLGLSQEGEG